MDDTGAIRITPTVQGTTAVCFEINRPNIDSHGCVDNTNKKAVCKDTDAGANTTQGKCDGSDVCQVAMATLLYEYDCT